MKPSERDPGAIPLVDEGHGSLDHEVVGINGRARMTRGIRGAVGQEESEVAEEAENEVEEGQEKRERLQPHTSRKAEESEKSKEHDDLQSLCAHVHGQIRTFLDTPDEDLIDADGGRLMLDVREQTRRSLDAVEEALRRYRCVMALFSRLLTIVTPLPLHNRQISKP